MNSKELVIYEFHTIYFCRTVWSAYRIISVITFDNGESHTADGIRVFSINSILSELRILCDLRIGCVTDYV